MNSRMSGRRAKVLFGLLGEDATNAGDKIAEMVDAHALKNDKQFYEAAQRAGRSARFVRDVLNLLAQGRITEAEAMLDLQEWGD